MARRTLLRAADFAVTAPLLRWSWSAVGEDSYTPALFDFRPSDPEAAYDMMAGRYLLASKLVDTDGISPFAIETENAEWLQSLHGFSWLRHFREAREPEARAFARMLVLDWIGHEGQFDAESWVPALTAVRVMNWLRHLDILTADGAPEQVRTIQSSLRTQVQSLKVRFLLATDPVDRLLTAAALAAAALCEEESENEGEFEQRLARLNAVLARQIDGDGMHLSRNPKTQLQLLVELGSLRRSLKAGKSEAAVELIAQVERMHECLDALTLGTGEPAYFNGCGQLPHDTLIAVQAGGTGRRRRGGLIGGYGVLRDGEAVVVADSGLLPPPDFAAEAHAGALAFEFSHGTELVVGNCGPAPASMRESRELFRQGVAHSTVTIEEENAQAIAERGSLAGRLVAAEGAAEDSVEVKTADHLLTMTTGGYAGRYGLLVERRITLLSGGTTLVGQDRLLPAEGAEVPPDIRVTARFHLAPGTMIRRTGDGMMRLILSSGAVWTFLWEGAELSEDDSVRQSATLGFHKTRQIVLEAEARPGAEIAWIFTREQG